MLSTSVSAIQQLEFTLQQVTTELLQAQNLKVSVGVATDTKLSVALTIEKLHFLDSEQTLHNLHWHCATLIADAQGYSCAAAEFSADTVLGALKGQMDIVYMDVNHWQLTQMKLTLPQGRLAGNFQQTDQQWQGKIKASKVKLDALLPLLPVTGITLSGKAGFSADFSGEAEHLLSVKMSLNASALSYADAEGLQAGENLALQTSWQGQYKNNRWQGKGSLKMTTGQLYSDPLFIDFAQLPLQAKVAGNWQIAAKKLVLDDLQINLKNALDVSGNAGLDLSALTATQYALNFNSPALGELYTNLLQSLLIGTSLDELDVKGTMQAQVQGGQTGLAQVKATLNQLTLTDQQQRFAVQELAGQLNWSSTLPATVSTLSWQTGKIGLIDIGVTAAEFELNANNFKLLKPLHLPLLGGEVLLSEAQLSHTDAGDVSWQMSASVDALQLSALSQAMDWPAFEGELNGHIPGVYYRQGRLTLDGGLSMHVFGGNIQIEGLELQDPLGVAPVFEANMLFKQLDLAQITHTFSFGRIEGLLDGEIKSLQMVAWEVNRFHASLGTPLDDQSRHRISQRAIDNLTSLGNGMSVNLSKTFLRYFEDFAYDRIALELDLSRNTAILDGIPHDNGGYYIVKGRGLPRIDVIAHTRKIAWKDLLKRLSQIQLDGVVIQ